MTTKTNATIEPLRIEVHFDDTGCAIYATRRACRLVIGIAFHEGKGQRETFSRAYRDLSRQLVAGVL